VPVFAARLHLDLLSRANLLRELGRTADSVKAARDAAVVIDRLPRKTSTDLYNLACVRARIAESMDEKKEELTTQEKDERERIAAAAVDALTRALADTTRDWSMFEHDHDLDALKGHLDFQALLARRRQTGKRAATGSNQTSTRSAQERLQEQQERMKDGDRLAKENPTSKWNRADLAASQLAVGQLLSDLQRYDEAEAMLKKSLEVRGGLVRDNPKVARYRVDAALVQMALATVHWRTLRLDQADRERTTGLELMETALRAEPAQSELYIELDNARLDTADKLLKAGLWEEAAPLFELVYRREPASLLGTAGLTWSTHAILRLLAGDAPGYRASCAKFYEQYNATTGSKFNLYRACLAGPRAIDDLRALAAVAESDAVASSDDDWNLLLAAMTCARAGEYNKAQSYFDRIRPNFAQASYIVPGQAIVHHHLGHRDQARKLIQQSDRFAEETFQKALAAPVQAAAFPYAEVNLMFEVLRREAHLQIEGKPASDVPWRQLFRGRLLARMGRDQEAEASFAAALAVRPDDLRVRADHARVLAELARQAGSESDFSEMMKLLERSLAKRPSDPDLLQARGEVYASRGHWGKAAADLNRFLLARPEISPKCYVAGSWVAGPFPFQPRNAATLRLLESPPPSGPNPDPFQPLRKPDDKGTVPWRPITLDASGFLDLGALMQPSDFTSAFVLARVYAPNELGTALLTACDDQMRLWINGTLISSQTLHYQNTAIPVQLRAGWNTLLARVNNSTQGYMLRLRFSNQASEIAGGFRVYLDQNHWNGQTAGVLSGLYSILPPNPAAWGPRAWLDMEVVRREDIFPRVLALRPTDAQLWVARGRYLAWLGRWDDARAAYERVIHNGADTEDALDEYACVLLLAGDSAAYRRWCEELAKQLERHPSNHAGFLLARAGVLAPKAFDDASRLVRSAERGAKDNPKSPHHLYVMGLSCLRAGRLDESVRYFQASLADTRHWLDINNWLGLALAHHHLGHAAEARRWYEKARDWIDQKNRERADKNVFYFPPLTFTDWVELVVLRREAEALILYDPVFPADPFAVPQVRHSK